MEYRPLIFEKKLFMSKVYIRRKGAVIDATNNDGLSPLFLAVKFGFLTLSRLLIKSGARVWMKSDTVCAKLIDEHDVLMVRIRQFKPGSNQKWTQSIQICQLTFRDDGYSTQSMLRSHPLCEALVKARDSNNLFPPTAQVSSAMPPSLELPVGHAQS